MLNKKLLLKTFRRLHHKETPLQEKILMALVSTGLVFFLGLFVYGAFFSYGDYDAPTLLPAEKTVLYMELQDGTLPPQLGDANLLKTLLSGVTLLTESGRAVLPTWAEENVGVAFLKNAALENEPLLFFKTPNRRQALTFFESKALPGETIDKKGDSDFAIYTYPQGQSFAFALAGDYVFVAENAEALLPLREVMEGTLASLWKAPDFQKIFGNLPRKSWSIGYIDLQSFQLPSSYPGSSLFVPVKGFTHSLGWSIRKQQNGFHFNTFLALNPEFMALDRAPDAAFNYDLSRFVDTRDLLLYAGGAHLGAEWQNTLETMSRLNPAYGLILEGMVRAQVSRFFGANVDLRNDIYPLFEGEYAFNLYRSEGVFTPQLMVAHTDRTFAEIKLEKLAKGFSLLGAQFTPSIKVVTLPDGTESRELVADPNSLKEISEDYKGSAIECTEVIGSAYGFCYALTDNLMILSTHLESVKKALDLTASSDFSLANFQPFRESLSNLSKINNEITFVHLTNVLPIFAERLPALGLPSLGALDSASWVKHTFKDGVSTEGFVLIK